MEEVEFPLFDLTQAKRRHTMKSVQIASAIMAVFVFALASAAFAAPKAAPTPGKSLLDPTNHILILIDHQPQMAFATKSIDIVALRNNVTGLAKAAKAFKVPTILTTVAEKSFSGPMFPELKAVFPEQNPIDRTTMNTWEDKRITDKVNEFGRGKVVIAALWTEVCGVGPVLSALDQGFEVYFVTDASGGVSDDAHNMAVKRMAQAGAHPITWLQYLLELQRDWARGETYDVVTGIAKEHGGGYGLGIIYAKEMFKASEGTHK
jgi:nicotinamidase-related amidase